MPYTINFPTFINLTFISRVLRFFSFLLLLIFVSDRLIAVWKTKRNTADCPETISGSVSASLPETNVLKWGLGMEKYVEWGGIDFFFQSLPEVRAEFPYIRHEMAPNYHLQNSKFIIFFIHIEIAT